MAAILYRRDGSWNVFEDDRVADAVAKGWYVLTPAGHPAQSASEDSDSAPEEAQPVAKKRGRPAKAKE